MKNTVICRPCKEENNWEIVDPNGDVMKQHYSTRREAVSAARKVAGEYSAELSVENKFPKSNGPSKSSKKSSSSASNKSSKSKSSK